MPFVQNNDARVYFEVAGEGPPLLLIAGIASDVASWAPIVPLLQDRFHLVMLDNRGAGRTESEGPIAPNDWIGDAIAVLDRIGIDRANVLGHSLGGMIGLRMAVAAPERIGNLVICAATSNPAPKTHALFGEMVTLYEGGMDRAAWFRLLFQWLFAPQFFADPSVVEEAAKAAVAYEFSQSPVDLRRQFEAVAGINRLNPVALSKPFGLILGERDLMVPLQTCRESFSGFQIGKETVIADAGHSVHWDQPERLANTVMSYFFGK